jgi:hypothetical protein
VPSRWHAWIVRSPREVIGASATRWASATLSRAVTARAQLPPARASVTASSIRHASYREPHGDQHRNRDAERDQPLPARRDPRAVPARPAGPARPAREEPPVRDHPQPPGQHDDLESHRAGGRGQKGDEADRDQPGDGREPAPPSIR